MSTASPALWWHPLVAATETLPPSEQPAALLALVRVMADRGEKAQAALQAHRAVRLAEAHGDAATASVARGALAGLVPRYHAQVASDPIRAAAWDAALRSAVRPAIRALEIGTGCGILAMMAARAGAEVTACERDPALAAIAEETVRANGFEDAIRILAKPAEQLAIPQDLPGPVDLLFLDVFADNLFAFHPFALIREIRHLLAASAQVIPARVALVGALAHSEGWAREIPGDVAGLDLSPLRAAAARDISLGSSGPVALRSSPAELVAATLPHHLPPDEGEALHMLPSAGGRVNGVAAWLRLELVPGQVLEAHPETRTPSFYARARFHAFDAQLDTRPGDTVTVRLAWKGRRASITQAA